MKKPLTLIALLMMSLALQTQGRPGTLQSGLKADPHGAAAGFIDQLEIKSVTDAYGGASFVNTGPYVVISGIVHGKINPNHPANAGIVDLNRAPVGTDGFVPYTTDFVILRPKKAATAKRILFYDVVNRGSKIALGTFNGAGATFDSGKQGDGLLLRHGYTIVWSGWQGEVRQSGNGAAGGTIGQGKDAQALAQSFPKTAADRNASGDPRRSLAERYSSKADYVNKVQQASKALVEQRLLLDEDVIVFVKAAQKESVP